MGRDAAGASSVYGFAELVEASFAWWDSVPTGWRVVVLLHAGLLPAVTEATRLTNLLG